MTISRIFLTSLLAVVTLAFTACKKDDAQPAFQYKTQGFVKGKITGSTADNSYTFNDDFNYNQYRLGTTESSYSANSNGTYSMEIARSDFNNFGSAVIDLSLTNATDTAPHGITIDISYSKELNDKFVEFGMNSNVANTTTITDFTFDAATGRAKGKFSLTGPDNSTGKSASVVGDFDVIAKKIAQ